MPRFEYTAEDAEGRPVSGFVDATSEAEVADVLREHGLSGVTVAPAAVPAERPLRGRRIDDEALAGRMAEITESGLPLAAGLRAAAEEFPGGSRRGLLAICDRLEAGDSLDEALVRAETRVPPYLVALARTGLRTGDLAAVLDRYLQQASARLERRRRLFLSLLYPTVLFAATLAIFSFLVVWIVPQFTGIYSGFGVELPRTTKFVLALSDLTINAWPFLLAFLAIAELVLVALAVTEGGRIVLGRIVQFVPLVGPVVRYGSLATFCDQLAALVSREVPLPEALRLTAAGVGDADLSQSVNRLADLVEQGHDPRDLVTEDRYGVAARQAFRWSDSGVPFARALEGAAAVYDTLARVNANILVAVTGPVTILGIAFVVGTVAASILLPLISLLNDLS